MCVGLKQVFSNVGDFASQEAFDCVWEKGATGILLETWDTAKHPIMHRITRSQTSVEWELRNKGPNINAEEAKLIGSMKTYKTL